ncbi:MAG: ATP synthase F1 subunit epsilon [Mariprofundaceae bacterium]|nr:ATP synthase F1 subunit epsilon [Mariprofundaceae bacterium]
MCSPLAVKAGQANDSQYLAKRKSGCILKIHIATAEGEVYRSEACSVVATTANGELKIFSNHAPLLAILRPGILCIDCLPGCQCPEVKRDEMVIFGGFMEVQPDNVTILADTVERSDHIDEARAKQAVQLARGRFRASHPENMDKALMELEAAIARFSVVRKTLGRH